MRSSQDAALPDNVVTMEVDFFSSEGYNRLALQDATALATLQDASAPACAALHEVRYSARQAYVESMAHTVSIT